MSQTVTATLKVNRLIDASPAKVFDAWLDPSKAKRFFFASPTGEIIRMEIDGRKGGKFLVTRRDDGQDIDHEGEYIEFDRPSRLVFTFRVPAFSKEWTTVFLDLAPEGSGTRLTLTHEGVLPDWEEKTQQGWNMILENLQSSLS